MDDAGFYLLWSVGYAEFNYNQSDISDIFGLSSDDLVAMVSGGLGIKILDMSLFEIAPWDLGSSVQIPNIAAVLTRKVDTELDGVLESCVVTQFGKGLSFKPIGRLGFFSFDGDKKSGEDLLIGLGPQRESIPFLPSVMILNLCRSIPYRSAI